MTKGRTTTDEASSTTTRPAVVILQSTMTASIGGSWKDDSYKDRSLTRIGVRGVRLRKFEEAVADLLTHDVTPSFCRLPSTPPDATEEWPFDCLPYKARVNGDGPGKIKGARALRKESQLRSMLQCVVAMLPDQTGQTSVVDFCGGTGHLALSLALLVPHCKVIVVDISSRSLQLVHKKALRCSTEPVEEDSTLSDVVERQKADMSHHEKIERQCAGVSNLYTFHGSIESYPHVFDIGVALHACGESSDITLRACGRVGANFCVSPCCVGKLHRQRRNPYIYHATASNVPTITYPQSKQVCDCFVDDSLWDDLVRAADYCDLQEMRTPRNATRRTAKALVETDRLLFMKERYGYQTALTRMSPWESSPKNDILLGWIDDDSRRRAQSPFLCEGIQPDEECNTDIQLSIKYLLQAGTNSPSGTSKRLEAAVNEVDWTMQEEKVVRALLQSFIESNEKEWTLPTGMGGRRRKLAHSLSEQMGLAHWGHGKRYAEKTVVVAKRSGQARVESSGSDC